MDKGAGSSQSSKTEIVFTAPNHVKKIVTALLPNNEKDDTCWNSGKSGHRLYKYAHKLDFVAIATRKRKWLERKKLRKKKNSKRVQFEAMLRLSEIMDEGTYVTGNNLETYYGYKAN